MFKPKSVFYFRSLDLRTRISIVLFLLTPVWFMIAGRESGQLDDVYSFLLGCAFLAAVIAVCEFFFRRRQRTYRSFR